MLKRSISHPKLWRSFFTRSKDCDGPTRTHAHIPKSGSKIFQSEIYLIIFLWRAFRFPSSLILKSTHVSSHFRIFFSGIRGYVVRIRVNIICSEFHQIKKKCALLRLQLYYFFSSSSFIFMSMHSNRSINSSYSHGSQIVSVPMSHSIIKLNVRRNKYL